MQFTGASSSGIRPAFLARGLTLVELGIVLAISAIFVVFVGQALISGATAYNESSTGLAAQAQLRYALDRMAREMREVGVVAGTPPAYNFATPASPTAGSNRVVFTKDDGNQVTIDGSSGTAVNMSYASPAATGRLADIAAVNALSISFYDHRTDCYPTVGVYCGVTTASSYDTYGAPAAVLGNSAPNLGAVEIALTVTVNGVSATGSTRVALRVTQ